MHAGMDLGHTDGAGTPVLNVQTGIVERVITDASPLRAFNGYGNGVVVHHPEDDTWALYAHMRDVAVTQGQAVPAGTRLGTMGNSSNGKFPGMGPHLHLELRRRRPNGRSPFPGPYPQSDRNPFNNLDPRPWMEGKGLRFMRRGGFEIQPGSEMAQTRPAWEGLGLAGYDPYPRHRISAWEVPESALGQKPIVSDGDDNAYEPPARFDRDVRFGLTPIEWAGVGTGALVLTGVAVAVVARARMRRRVAANRRRRRRRTSR